MDRDWRKWTFQTLVARIRAAINSAPAPANAVDHGTLAGLGDDDHSQYVHLSAARVITAQHQFAPASAQPPFTLGANAQGQTVTGLRADQLNKTITAGGGLTGGGDLTADRTLTVGAGDGIDVLADAVAVDVTDIIGAGLTEDAGNNLVLGTPSTLTVSSANSVSGATHSHAITSSSNPGAAASLLASSAGGYLQLVRMGAGVAPVVPLHAAGAGEQLRLEYNGSNYASLTVGSDGSLVLGATGSAGNISLAPAGDVAFDPAGNDVYPQNNYDLNFGLLNKKWLTLHAAELWVETLVAQDTLATVGGRVLVGPTTVLTEDLVSTNLFASNNGDFETLGGGGADVFASWTEVVSNGAIAAETVYVHSGARAAKLTAGASLDTRLDSVFWAVNPGETYTVELWTRGDGTNAGRYYVWNISLGNFLLGPTTTGVSGTTYTLVRFSFTVPASTYSVLVGVECPAVNGGVAYFDDVAMYPSTLTVRHNQMAVGDIVYMEANGKIEFMQITSGPSGTGPYVYGVTRNLDGTGANDWYKGDAVFNTGQAGDGFIDLYSLRGVKSATQYGPTIVGNIRNSATYNDWAEAWTIGNLNGLYGYSTDTFGAAFGKYANGQSFLTADAANGIRMMYRSGGANYCNAQWNLDGSLVIGQVAPGQSNLYLASGGVQGRTNTTVHLDLQSDGDVFIGENTAAAGTTYLSFFNNAQTYNGESMSAGDVLFGDNSSSKANIFWDKSAGKLQFRGGQSAECEIGTDGKLRAGSGAIVLSSNGMTIAYGSGEPNAIRFMSGSNEIARFFAGDYLGWGTDSTLHLQHNAATGTAGVLIDLWNGVTQETRYIFAQSGLFVLPGAHTSGLWVNSNGSMGIYDNAAAPGTITQVAGEFAIYSSPVAKAIVLNRSGNITATGNLTIGKIVSSTALGARVYRTTTQTINTTNWTAIQFNAERFDNDAIHDNATNNTRLTCNTAGVYVISGSVEFASNATGFRGVQIRLNGVQPLASHLQAAVNGAVTQMSVSCIYQLAANDYVEMLVRQNSGGNLDVNSFSNYTPEFAMVRIA